MRCFRVHDEILVSRVVHDLAGVQPHLKFVDRGMLPLRASRIPGTCSKSSGVRTASKAPNVLEDLFGDRVSSLRLQLRPLVFRYRSPEHMLDYFRSWHGPTKVAFESLDDAAARELAADLLDLYRKYNRASDGTLVAPSEYAEVVAVVA